MTNAFGRCAGLRPLWELRLGIHVPIERAIKRVRWSQRPMNGFVLKKWRLPSAGWFDRRYTLIPDASARDHLAERL
jgi:hypothetical protein